ncbi:hypothetical protein BgiBS90_006589, partial [Biomphalaria glabrata]
WARKGVDDPPFFSLQLQFIISRHPLKEIINSWISHVTKGDDERNEIDSLMEKTGDNAICQALDQDSLGLQLNTPLFHHPCFFIVNSLCIFDQ